MLTIGNARFTFMTDRMVRMEWSENAEFEDRATLAVCNRHFPIVKFSAKQSGRNWLIKTSALTIRYRNNGRRFSRSNLSASFELNERLVEWFCGRKDRLNTGGTYSTLDGSWGGKVWHYRQDDEGKWIQHKYAGADLGHGLISRSGWTVVDDSSNHVLDPDTVPGRLWIKPRPAGSRQDLYFMAYGHDYQQALHDSARLLGKQPLPPRYAFGYWYSKYWAYTDREIESLVNDFNTMQIPLDVMVIDMDWHLPGWTGYTWDRRYFIDPPDFLEWMKQQKLKITLNLHPADGVADHEEAFKAMCNELDTDGKTHGKLADRWRELALTLGRDPDKMRCVPFAASDPDYMDAYFKHLHHPQEKAGVDFWWMDWQQGSTGSGIPGFNPLPWLNQLHWEDQERSGHNKRPLVFSRFGGIGAGRYPIGFSGDVVIAWESLAYQPYFTATAANVLYGYWSHDIGGHFKGDGTDPELFTRWMQFGVYSPILRTHVCKDATMERRPWKFADPYSGILSNLIRLRYELVPYIYSEARKTVDSALSLLRPMYYSYPEEEQAYRSPAQYMFGDSMLVAPVTKAADSKTELSKMQTWLPPGTWIDTASGCHEKGGRWITRQYTVDEIPVFVRPGTVIPGQTNALRLNPGSYADLLVTAWPGADGEYDLYEDDGVTQDYLNKKHAFIPIKYRKLKSGCRITIGKAKGSFDGFLKTRSLEVRLPLTVPPDAVKIGGKELKWYSRLNKSGWTYDGQKAETVIQLKQVNISTGVVITVQYPGSNYIRPVEGLRGLMRRLDRAAELTRLVSPVFTIGKDERLATDAAQTGNRISRRPENFSNELRSLKRMLKALPGALDDFYKGINKQQKKRASAPLTVAKARDIVKAALNDFFAKGN